MLKVKVYNQDGATIGSQELSEKVFGVKPKPAVIHQVAKAMMANKRQVLAHTKTRGEVRGGGIKPWRQKGTGRARHGSIRSPLWVGGGVTFGPRNDRNFKQKINNKMRRKAIAMGLSDRVKEDKFVVLDRIEIGEIKTKNIIKMFQSLNKVFFGDKIDRVENTKEIKELSHPAGDHPLGENKETRSSASSNSVENKEITRISRKPEIKPKKILILIAERDEKIQKSCKNISRLKCVLANNVNLLDILANEYILTTIGGIAKIEETLDK